MNGQLSLFDFIPEKKVFKPGEWVTDEVLGEELSFDDIVHMAGQIIIKSCHTESRKWYKAVLIERIIEAEDGRALIYYDGHKQRGRVNEQWFDKCNRLPVYAWKIKE